MELMEREGGAPELGAERGARGASEAQRAGNEGHGMPSGAEAGAVGAELAEGERAAATPLVDVHEDGVIGGQARHDASVALAGERAFWSSLGTKRDASSKREASDALIGPPVHG